MSFLSKLFGKKEKSDLELYMEQREKERDAYEELSLRKIENKTQATEEGSWRENKLLLGDLTEIPKQYYFEKEDSLLLCFVDYFHEGIFYGGDYVVDEDDYRRIGLLYSLFQNPEKTLEQWHQKFLENKKKAESASWMKEIIIDEISDVLSAVTTFGLQGCEKYILPMVRQRDILDYWFCKEDEYYVVMLAFIEKLFYLGELENATELLIKLFGKKGIKQEELRKDFLDNYYEELGRMLPKQMGKIRETLQKQFTEAGYEDFVQDLKKKDAEIRVNPYINVYEMAVKFFEDPEGTLAEWLGILREHEEEMKAELHNPQGNEEKRIGYYLIEEVLDAIEIVGRYGFTGVPKCLGENEEWCQFLIYSGCGGCLSMYLQAMFNSNHVEMVEHILEMLKPIGSVEKENWNEFSQMLGFYSEEMFEKWNMPEREEDFEKQAEEFSARWKV